jgi:cytochrome c556
MLGLSRQEVLAKHYAVYGKMLDGHQLRQQILPMIETAGLIVQEQDPHDKRKVMISPAPLYQLSEVKISGGKNHENKENEQESGGSSKKTWDDF